MSASASFTDHQAPGAVDHDDLDDAPLRTAAGFGLAVLLSIPLWSGIMLAAWAWLA